MTKTRRPRGTGSFIERSPGRWLIRYSLETNALTGQRRRGTATVKGSADDAKKELRRLQRSVDDGAHVDPSTVTVKKWLEIWLAEIKSEVSAKTHERYAEIVKNFLSAELGNVKLAKLSSADIGVVYTKWQTSGRLDGKPGGLSPRTRRHIHRILRSALARAVEQRRIGINPADAFSRRLPKVPYREMVTLTAEQSATLLAAIKSHRVYWPTMLALFTGMRRGEILPLRWKNMDLERGAVRVVEGFETTKEHGLRVKRPKTEKARAIKLSPFAVSEMRRLKVEQAQVMLKLGARQSGDTLVFAEADGSPYIPLTLTHDFAKRMKLLKDLPRVRFHDLRHSHATQLLVDGTHPKVVQERLGHADIATTLNLYSHVTGTMQEDAADKLEVSLGGAIGRGNKT